MLGEVLESLQLKSGSVVCDCTLGGAGHSVKMAAQVGRRAFCSASTRTTWPSRRLAGVWTRRRRSAQAAEGQLRGPRRALCSAEVPGVDGFLSILRRLEPAQLDIPGRGFSYHEDAPLDMRMDPGNNTLNAAEVVNTYNEADLARILRLYGEEKYASQIAREIVRTPRARTDRNHRPICRDHQGGYPGCRSSAWRTPGARASRPFASRSITRLDVLERGLDAATRWLNPGGRICVISYHSLEDRIVKNHFKEMSQGCTCPPEIPVCVCGNVPILKVITRKPLVAQPDEVERNPRARSAKIRVAQRL